MKVAALRTPVLIVGESGVGKNALARLIHHGSGQAESDYAMVHCSTADQAQLEAEIFGERASGQEPVLASQGTLLLDDIGGLGPDLQARLFRALEDESFVPTGGGERKKTRARILATGSQQLERAVASGTFRQDLYWRLRPIRLVIAPLRERRLDIPMLCRHFLRSASEEGADAELPQELMEGFLRYEWPGNVRELGQAIKRFLLLPDSEAVLAELESQPVPALDRGWSRREHQDDGNGSRMRPWGVRETADQGARPGLPSSTSPDGVGSSDSSATVDRVNGERHENDQGSHYGTGHHGNGNGYGHGSNGFDPSTVQRDAEGRVKLKAIGARAAEEAEKRIVLEILEKVHWNRKRAASRMDICYKTLLNKLERWEIDP